MQDFISSVEDAPSWVKAIIVIGIGTMVGVVTAYIVSGVLI